MNANGGFDTWELGVALRGKGREPINSFLPLFIHEVRLYLCSFFSPKEHWKRVKIQLKSILGYFCTLDPLGYSEKQLDVMFMILGTMIATLSNDPGEHQLRYINERIATDVKDFYLLSKEPVIRLPWISTCSLRSKRLSLHS